LEEATSPRGFSITESKIPILLALKRIEELRPHEETVQEDLNSIIRALERDPLLRHPIIADSASGAVLDGTHRLAALKCLGCRTIPVALIDYRNPLVAIERWFRTIRLGNPHDFMNRLKELSPVSIPVSEADKSLLDRSSYASLQDHKDCWVFRSNESAPLDMCRRAFALEQIAVTNNGTIAYTDKANIASLSASTLLMSTIRLEKNEVVDCCRRHLLFPPKSTRHLIPSRPLGTNVPLRWLKDLNVPEAEAEFEKHLSKMTVRRLPEGSTVGSRRYMEEVFLFE
jgi:L-serine kinase (ADP)